MRRLRLPSREKARRAATIKQRHRLAELAQQAGVEAPAVVWFEDAADAIERLEAYLQPSLDGMDQLR